MGSPQGKICSVPTQQGKRQSSRRRKRPFAFVTIVHTCSTAPTSTIEGTHDRGSPRPSFYDLMRPRHLCSSLLSRMCSHPLHRTILFISHNARAHGSCLEKKKMPSRSAGCEEKRKDWAKHWQCDTKVRDLKDMPWICSRAGGPLRLFLRSFVGGRLCERQRC